MDNGNSTPRTIEIQLTKGYVAVVDECDKDLAELRWSPLKDKYGKVYARANTYDNTGKRTTILMHRMIMIRMADGQITNRDDVDHKNLNTLDNRRENLRLATRSQNRANGKLQRNSTSGYKGVTFDKASGKWIAQIKYQGRRYHLGICNTPEEAHQLYCVAATRLYGEFARFA